eukprot:6210821-Pleurochrysis_carterae.AAC.1
MPASSFAFTRPSVQGCFGRVRCVHVLGSAQPRATLMRGQVFGGVSFRLPHGAKTAVLGKSGSGKSTLLKLLSRLYQPERGHIKAGQRLSHASIPWARASERACSQLL